MKGRGETARAYGCPTPHKIGYEHRAEARRFLRRIQGIGSAPAQPGRRLHVYRCECGLFHLGNDYRGAVRTRSVA